MTENDARLILDARISRFDHAGDVNEALEIAIKAIEEVQQYREIGTVEEIRKIIEQGIDNCYMAHKYEQPGYEEGMCAGLRTMNGDGEPAYKCQLCRLYYLSDSERSDNHDGE